MKKPKKFTISGDFLFSMLDNTPFGILAFSHKGDIQWANIQALNFLEISRDEKDVIDHDILEVVNNPIELKTKVEKMLNKRKPFDLEGIYYQNRYLTFRGRITKKGMILTIADITNIKMSEFLSLNSMLEGQEMERKRLSREIHDGIGPLLSTLKLNLANIQDEVSLNDDALHKKFMNSNDLIDEVANDLRSISHNLLPKVLLDFGLIEALESLNEKVSTTKDIEPTFLHTGFNTRLEQVLELGIYRICQELINNTLKHARAKKISLQLIKSANTLRLIYEDDGVGFSVKSISNGLGIMNIENRIKAFEGELIFDSTIGKGMTATIEIPIKFRNDEEN